MNLPTAYNVHIAWFGAIITVFMIPIPQIQIAKIGIEGIRWDDWIPIGERTILVRKRATGVTEGGPPIAIPLYIYENCVELLRWVVTHPNILRFDGVRKSRRLSHESARHQTATWTSAITDSLWRHTVPEPTKSCAKFDSHRGRCRMGYNSSLRYKLIASASQYFLWMYSMWRGADDRSANLFRTLFFLQVFSSKQFLSHLFPFFFLELLSKLCLIYLKYFYLVAY